MNALNHVKNISEQVHYFGSPEQEYVKKYIIEELEKLNLDPTIQEGYAISNDGVLCKPQNIVAKIKGTTRGKKFIITISL